MTKFKTAAKEKRYACGFAGCDRAFTRQEHLSRHSQNHIGGDYTCERCRAHFRRQDLLGRHLTRHRRKDLEGGSLMTRKRSWKDADGKIVAKRPSGWRDERPLSTSTTSDGFDATPVSPPSSADVACQSVGDGVQVERRPWIVDSGNAAVTEAATMDWIIDERFWENPLQQNRRNCVLQHSAPFEDVFNPDTASSFNMPFTTMSNYEWLFDVSDVVPGAKSNVAATDDIDHPHVAVFDGAELSDEHFHLATVESSAQKLPTQDAYGSLAGSIAISCDNGRNGSHKRPRSLASDASSSLNHSSSAQSYTQAATASEESSQTHGQRRSSSVMSQPADGVERPMSVLHTGCRFPQIDALARSQVLNLIEDVRPMTPDGMHVMRDNPLLSQWALQTYSDLFFSRFNATCPLIHQATFEPCKTETLLLLSILLLGATYCEKEAHQLAVCIHDVLRPRIFAHDSFGAKPQLWVLQTILLVECFGKSRAGQKQHDMSHLFHGLLINLIRRSDCQTIRPEAMDLDSHNLEDSWHLWVDAEQKKRLALLCFMWDTQHAVLFCQSLCMSAFELQSTLPCDQFQWEAQSAEEWHILYRTRPQSTPFLNVLKGYLTTPKRSVRSGVNAFSRSILLHGLMSIAWDMNRREQTSLGRFTGADSSRQWLTDQAGVAGSDQLGDWRSRLAEAYDAWKVDFELYTESVMQSHGNPLASLPNANNDQKQARREFCIYSTVNLALFHSANIILFSEFLDVQIYAGAKHILGRQVGRTDYLRSQRVVRQWARGSDTGSGKAAWHAALVVKDAMTNLENFEAGGLFIYPWCLYLATITIWSYHHAKPQELGASRPGMAKDDEDEMIWDAKADMTVLIDSMTRAGPEQWTNVETCSGKVRTAGLTAVIARHLSKVRWAVVHDGMIVLKGLVPWRLVHEADGL